MKVRIERFLADRRGTSFEGIALSVSIIAVAFVASADMLDYLTKSHGPSGLVAAVRPAVPANVASNGLDETPTGSVQQSGALPQLITRSVLDPCTGRIK